LILSVSFSDDLLSTPLSAALPSVWNDAQYPGEQAASAIAGDFPTSCLKSKSIGKGNFLRGGLINPTDEAKQEVRLMGTDAFQRCNAGSASQVPESSSDLVYHAGINGSQSDL
jgi:hypothetical protein